MLKKIIVLFIMLLLTACSNEKKIEIDTEKGEYKSLNIKVNSESKDNSYLVYLLPLRVKEKDSDGGYYGPFETDKNGEVNIDLENNDSIEYYLEQDNKLQIIVTTKEDTYLENPLNKETIVEFIKDEDTDIKYYSKVPNIVIDIVDKISYQFILKNK